jgi:hypothetical protein
MISIITSISYDNYLFKKKKIIISALYDLIKNFKKFKIQSELIIVSNYKGNEKIFINIKKTNFTNVKFFILKGCYSQMRSYAFGLKNCKYENILIRDIDVFFNNPIYKFIKQNKINGIYYVPRFSLYSNKLSDLKYKKLFSKPELVDISKSFYLANLQTLNAGCFMYFKKKDILKVGFPMNENYSDTYINYAMNVDLGLKQKNIKGGKIYKFISNKQYHDRLKPLKLSSFQKLFETYLHRFFTGRQINIVRGLFNYPKLKVSIPGYYKFYGGKIIDSYERLLFKILLKKIFPFYKLYKKLD